MALARKMTRVEKRKKLRQTNKQKKHDTKMKYESLQKSQKLKRNEQFKRGMNGAKPKYGHMPKMLSKNVKREDKKGLKRMMKTKFEEYLEMDMRNGSALGEEDVEIERRLAKRLKVKEGKLIGDNDGLNELFENTNGVQDLEEDIGMEMVLDETNISMASKKIHLRSKKSKMMHVYDDAQSTPSSPCGSPKSHENDNKLQEATMKSPIEIDNLTYVLPHMRYRAGEDTEKHKEIRRRARGLLNKLSEQNVESITREMASLFSSACRAVSSQVIIEEVLRACSIGPRGNEQYAAVFASFVAAMACLVGIDFGANVLASLAKLFEDEYLKEDNLSLRNLTLLLSHLYIFGVCSCDLIYDFLIKLSKQLLEIDVATILAVLQCCGMKIRTDDPIAMKNFIQGVHTRAHDIKASSKDGEAGVHGKRMGFMLETILDIKNNKRRPKEDGMRHAQIKKWLQKLGVENVMIHEMKWSKLLVLEKKGQWWLSGGEASAAIDNAQEVANTIDREVGEAQNMLQLASSQRINTDARRAIFCVIMSGEDYIDAFEKLLRLNLPGKQDRDIMRVLVECCLQEKVFNKYYCLLAKKICEHNRNHRITLQNCVMDQFKELDAMPLQRSMNLARFEADMIVSLTVTPRFLQATELSDVRQLTPRRIVHFRLLFESIFEYSDELLSKAFTRVAAIPDAAALRNGVKWFIKEFVLKRNAAVSDKFRVLVSALNNKQGIVFI